MKNPVRPELVEGRAGFFIAQRVSMLWAVHASTLLSTNGLQHMPTALSRIKGVEKDFIMQDKKFIRCFPYLLKCVSP
ncbi:MAG: hypothetical protein CVV06_19015 [Gammaproteobacteria bacterium HGW-Gammaproteobacteria-10]|nr:MAG: hypothetical protein CVV06_19015 [Gammaproteobacteria bacterium HGW-Gammaproteobacteria-10]